MTQHIAKEIDKILDKQEKEKKGKGKKRRNYCLL